MINFLHIQRFQSHNDTILEFSDSVNVIVGQSDSGKTAIIRALRWLIFNQPQGNAFCSNFSKSDTIVEAKLGDLSVLRSKGSKELYKINEIALEAFKTNVPDEIASALNMDETNLQTQLESHYLLSQSSGEVAKHFNKIVGFDKIDIATSNINSAIRDLNSDIKRETETVKKIEKDIKDFDYLTDFEVDLIALETYETELNTLDEKITNLTTAINEYNSLLTQLSEYDSILIIEKPLQETLFYYSQLAIINQDITDLEELLDKLHNAELLVSEYNLILGIEDELNAVLNNFMKVKELNIQAENLKNMIKNIEDKNTELVKLSALYDTLHAKLEKELEGECPFCGRKS